MREHATSTPPAFLIRAARHAGVRAAVVAVLALLCSFVWPFVPICAGALLIVAVALHTWSPDFRPYVQTLLRVPIGRTRRRQAHLLLVTGAGGLLLASGTVGATVGGRMRSERERHEILDERAEEHVVALLRSAREHIATGSLGPAELVLLEAHAVVPPPNPERREEIDRLLEQVRGAGDPELILAILVRLPQAEFEAFESGDSVPPALEFDERALTLRAVEVARAQLTAARRLRARG